MNESECLFCTSDREHIDENDYCYAIHDKYPVSKGHVLIVSQRHVSDYFQLNDDEKKGCWDLMEKVKETLEPEYKPDGWNIGFNSGAAAGQTVFHFHCHLIPRYKGDMKDPRGGVRHSVKGKGYY